MGIATTTALVPGPRQLSDGNPEGTVLGGATNSAGLPDKVGFFGHAPGTQSTVSLGSGTLAQVIQALGSLGIINQVA